MIIKRKAYSLEGLARGMITAGATNLGKATWGESGNVVSYLGNKIKEKK